MKRTWATMKEIIGSKRSNGASFPKRLVVNNFEIFDQMTIAENFNNFFSEIGPKLASKIPDSIISFEHFLQGDYQILEEKPVTDDELNEAIKSSGYDEISSDVIKHISPLIFDPLKYIFNLSLEKGIFPDQLKIAKVTPLFKKGDNASMDNYRPISVLPCFSKILERIIYNRFYTFFIQNDILYEKQFRFQKQHSTEHAIIHLVNDIFKSFDSNKYTLGVFIDLTKAFDTVDHNILLRKLFHYGVRDNNLKLLQSYLQNRKQYISYQNTEKTECKNVICGVPQGSILGPLLFLVYINDLWCSTPLLETIMFADDTNLFYSHNDVKELLQTMNAELSRLNDWFCANKLSLNIDKTKYVLFHKAKSRDNLPLVLPDLRINNAKIKEENSLKFLGVMIDENLTWKTHVELVENKVSKSVGILFKASRFLNANCLRSIYFALVHPYINYANIAWASTNKTYLKRILGKQKQAAKLLSSEDLSLSSRMLMKQLNILNVYQINILQHLLFMFKAKNNIIPRAFMQTFSMIDHIYPTRFSDDSFKT